MTFGTPLLRRTLAAALLLTSPLASPADALDADALIARLARPAPANIAFQDIRFSSLLREPLRVSGELGYSGPTTLDRRVTAPYEEHTSIRGESVRVERPGEPARSFALKRAPELKGLLTGFTALLIGDAAGLKREFSVQVDGSDESWTLELQPIDPKARRRIARIVINGGGNEPRCFSMLNAQGGGSVMLLGESAQADLGAKPTLDGVLKLCSGGE
jgi:Outer membrane lipoprotein carrier protein LolA-like